MKNKILIISGPTGVGKTELSINLAKALNGEIISADSVQVYKELDIGSAKILPNQMQGVRHHLIDCLELSENFGVDTFVEMAKNAINDISGRGKLPIIVGGTAFYIQALLKGIEFDEEDIHDDSYRNILEEKEPWELFEMLKAVDEEYALTTHMNNKRRVIRALEYHHYTGEKFSEYNSRQASREAIYDYKYFILDDDRENIYKKCDIRVDKMLETGLYEEALKVFELGYSRDLTSMQGIGYRELFDHFEGKCSKEKAIENIKTNTRHYVKRQLTWFRREKDVIYINKMDYGYDETKILDYILSESRKLMEK